MIELNADESMLILLLKGHEHKEVPRTDEERFMHPDYSEYFLKCLRHRCYGDANCEHGVDVFTIYASLAEKLLTKRELVRCLDNCQDTQFHQYSPEAAICSALRLIKVRDDDGNVLIKFDTSLIVKDPDINYGSD